MRVRDLAGAAAEEECDTSPEVPRVFVALSRRAQAQPAARDQRASAPGAGLTTGRAGAVRFVDVIRWLSLEQKLERLARLRRASSCDMSAGLPSIDGRALQRGYD
jgi:hypothetical protein